MEFEGPQGVYGFDGLSSGQLMILRVLLEFAEERIHRSIVLIDELELHLHPLWQTRLYHSLAELGHDNQYFFTTHSTHLRDLMRGTFFHCTGELEDKAVEKQEA
jgi:predicted ATP-dependent endonuclease of OLD family